MDHNRLIGLFFVLGILVMVQVFFFATIVKALDKVNKLNPSVKDRIIRIKHYIALARQMSRAELIKAGSFTDGDLEELNQIDDIDELVKTAKARIKDY
jgi:hypothetical protein